jgi:hypothetical protein
MPIYYGVILLQCARRLPSPSSLAKNRDVMRVIATMGILFFESKPFRIMFVLPVLDKPE